MITEEFKLKCLQAFQYASNIGGIIDALTKTNLNNLRLNFDFATDELQMQINQPIGIGEESIHNARVTQLKNMFDCFNELYELIEKEDVTRETGLLQTTGD